MIFDAIGGLARRLRGFAVRDPRQASFCTAASLRWVIRHRAFTPWYLVRYARLARWRLQRPDIVFAGMVFLGRGVTIDVRRGYGRLLFGRWVHVGELNRFRVHEGTLRIGSKSVLGRDNTVNTYLSVEIGESALIADGVYICDFDHRYDDLTVPIKDQGIVKGPVHIADDVWLGTKVSVLRNTAIGTGVVVAAHAVVRGVMPARTVVGGIPAKVLRDRAEAYEQASATRAALADISRKTRLATKLSATGSGLHT